MTKSPTYINRELMCTRVTINIICYLTSMLNMYSRYHWFILQIQKTKHGGVNMNILSVFYVRANYLHSSYNWVFGSREWNPHFFRSIAVVSLIFFFSLERCNYFTVVWFLFSVVVTFYFNHSIHCCYQKPDKKTNSRKENFS